MYRSYRNEQFSNFLDGTFELHLGAILGVFDGDQNVKLIGEMLPVGFATVGVLLRWCEKVFNKILHKLRSIFLESNYITLLYIYKYTYFIN